jgi:hypothetical protein
MQHGSRVPKRFPRAVRQGIALVALAAGFAGAARPAAALGFVENRGQLSPSVRYYACASGATFYFTETSVVLDLKEPLPRPADLRSPGQEQAGVPRGSRRGCAVWARFEKANPSPRIEARRRATTRFNYLRGNDPAGWQRDVPVFEEIVYHDLWPGVDLVWRREGGRLVYEVVAATGADPGQVSFRYEGVQRIAPLGGGTYRIETALGNVVEERPGTGSRGLRGTFLFGTETAVSESELRDDPALLAWSTYLGGGQDEWSWSVLLDEEGSPIVVGWTMSPDFPTTPGAYDESWNGGTVPHEYDAFVSKLDPSGTTLLWSTFLGGTGDDLMTRARRDAAGNIVLLGYTSSQDFPTSPGAYDQTNNGGMDIFLTCLDASGSSLLWSTLLGGSDFEDAWFLDFDPAGNIFLTGGTYSADFPTTPGAFDETFNGGLVDAFVAKMDATGSHLLWSTLLGGSGDEFGLGLFLDAGGHPVVGGWTQSPDFPTTAGAYQTTFGGVADVFVTELDAAGTVLRWSTFLGGTGEDVCYATGGFDASGNVVLGGYTDSPDFPTTPGAYDESPNGARDVFAAKLGGTGEHLVWSTVLGGAGDDVGGYPVSSAAGGLVLAGFTSSSDFPVTPGAYDASYNGDPEDAFLCWISETGSELVWSSYLGGGDDDWSASLELDASGNAVLAGMTLSSDFPVTPAAQDTSANGGWDVFVSRMDLRSASGLPGPGAQAVSWTLSPVWPNPSRAGGTLLLGIPREARVSLEVFDASGRRVRTLVGGSVAAGQRRVSWDGRDAGGVSVASGLYFIRARTASGWSRTRRLVVLH